jgi:hypothetical protein
MITGNYEDDFEDEDDDDDDDDEDDDDRNIHNFLLSFLKERKDSFSMVYKFLLLKHLIFSIILDIINLIQISDPLKQSYFLVHV